MRVLLSLRCSVALLLVSATCRVSFGYINLAAPRGPRKTSRIEHKLNKVLQLNEGSALRSPLRSSLSPLDEPAGGGPSRSQLNFTNISAQLDAFKSMAIPYFTETRQGKVAFATVVGLTLLNSGVSVAFSYVGRDFWSALNSKDPEQFNFMLQKFSAALVAGVPVSVIYRYQRERLSLLWREWMTSRTLELYYSNRVYYSLERSKEIDNPDQRIAEDVKAFTQFSLTLFITAVTSVVDLASFSAILYSIQPSLFLAIFAYASFGTVTTAYIGKNLVGLNYDQLQKEADFRYALVRIRENAESIAFYEGESIESDEIGSRFARVVNNTQAVIESQRNVEFFTTSYRYLIQVLPVSVVAPLYFAGTIPLGVVSQSSGAFNHILSDLSVIVNQFESLSAFSAGIDRLHQFMKAIREADAEREFDDDLLTMPNATKIEAASDSAAGVDNHQAELVPPSSPTLTMSHDSSGSSYAHETSIAIETNEHMSGLELAPILGAKNVTLFTPDMKRTLIHSLSFTLPARSNLLIVGNSGVGKSSFLRAVAGLWSSGSGSIQRPPSSQVFFLPQKPYCPLGTLRDQLLYPGLSSEGHASDSHEVLAGTHSDSDLLKILSDVGLEDLPYRAGDGDPVRGLSATLDWGNTLSLGEQQRLSFGRLIVNRPSLAILDEATSALDIIGEKKMYGMLADMNKLTYISVGHRPSLVNYHNKRLRLKGEEGFDVENIEVGDAAVVERNL